ncbi:MAG: phosphatidylserine decarboxylase family protein [Deltaproteobacteria bacterium]|nr:phosphatidylserine decarboxylase family protein [Deltaproteobacteria bacterium]
MRIPFAKEGYVFIFIAAVPVVITGVLAVWPLFIFFALVLAFVLNFFRDPERDIPSGDDVIVSPADGRVIICDVVREDRLLKAEANKISIFMNVFNVHVNRAPADCKVLKVAYNEGKFMNAAFDKASLENEQNAILAEAKNGKKFIFTQIAGLIARRIVCYSKEGDALTKGARFGMIRFGSRLDVYLPLDAKVEVKVGDKVSAGSSILARW